jgi:hypothetical protein
MRHEETVRMHPRWWPVVLGIMAVVLGMALPISGAIATEVNYLDTEVTYPDPEYLLVRGAFEITGPPNQWYGVYFQIRFDASTPLKEEGKEGFLKLWNNIFTPENIETARYTDCRLDFQIKDIAAATNLPKGKRTVLWMVCDIWDTEGKQYIGSGWSARAPFIVTTDASGKIVKVELFRTPPFTLKNNHETAKINAKESELSLKHLKLKPGVKSYRAIEVRHENRDFLVLGDQQADLRSENRGYFFEPIDSPQKAAELVEVGYPRAVIIETPEQYELIMKALKAKGWKAENIPMEKPPSYGLKVTEEPQLGYRVTALMIDYIDYYSLGLRYVMYREFAVAPDGRLGITDEKTCIEAPQTPYGAGPGWTQPLPIDPEDYTQVLRLVLSADGSRTIPPVIVTDRTVAVPCAEDSDADWFENDYDRWPEHASR